MNEAQLQVCAELKAVIRRASELGVSIYTFDYGGWYGAAAGADSDEAKVRAGCGDFVGFYTTSNVSDVYEEPHKDDS